MVSPNRDASQVTDAVTQHPGGLPETVVSPISPEMVAAIRKMQMQSVLDQMKNNRPENRPGDVGAVRIMPLMGTEPPVRGG
ncbi:hypothetical protein M2352_001130 [Azospirillum fermentarium]|uniref:hypothetical protein n=1 Tax=Azospirillum fermentarium TaxID=1233114 RepID=UPI0022260FE9|nr:hypothetical protein [Azospirillum fermentarium]MCW2245539.1 hypothetical protein [Azospirillum fermentarium]